VACPVGSVEDQRSQRAPSRSSNLNVGTMGGLDPERPHTKIDFTYYQVCCAADELSGVHVTILAPNSKSSANRGMI
jgi:hypothetical protein